MFEYDRIDMYDEIDVNKTDESGGCIICHYWYFLKVNLDFS